MKTDRNKNNVKSEENMILEKSRRSDANVFPVENKGKGKIAKRHGVNPLDREKWILVQRSAMNGAGAEM